MAQQPDELSLELADVLNILDKTDDGTGDRLRLGQPCGKVGNTRGRWLPNRQDGVPSSQASQLRALLPPPKPQQTLAALSCDNAGTATLAPAVGHGRAATATQDVSRAVLTLMMLHSHLVLVSGVHM